MKIALAQINTTIGDFDGIVQKVKKNIQGAKEKDASLIAFPEMTTTGYPPRDLLEVPSFIEENLKALQEIAREAKGIDVVVGYVERNPEKKGKALYNAAGLCRDGKVLQTYFKNLLPTYDVFDEGRYFEPGVKAGVWNSSGLFGISICEDYWNPEGFGDRRLYPKDPIKEQVSSGARWLLNISASPYSRSKEKVRAELLRSHAKKYRLPLFFVNQVGGSDELIFDGCSLALDSRGRIMAKGKPFQEDLVIADLDDCDAEEFPTVPVRLDERESVYEALILGIKDYVRKCGFQKVALGLSGGVDSALTAVLAVHALGAQNVLGVMMPSPYSSPQSIEDAQTLAQNLKMPTRTIPISSLYESFRKEFQRDKKEPDLADENLQARIRGNLLMTISNRENFLILTTGNKSEISVGYCTLYGDMSGGLAVISDLTKTDVYELCDWINQREEVIPEKILTKAPSAELKPNQRDQDNLPPYETLDSILTAYVEEHISQEEIVANGFSLETVRWVIQKVNQNEYKRRQMAPGLKVTSKAFGIGRRLPIARKI